MLWRLDAQSHLPQVPTKGGVSNFSDDNDLTHQGRKSTRNLLQVATERHCTVFENVGGVVIARKNNRSLFRIYDLTK